ncbi:MAG: reverse transcriptase family protein, partial [Bacteroidota bacterium]
MDPKSKEKTAFSVNDRLFAFRTMPFGLRNAPAHFSRFMSSILTGFVGSIVLVYLDDIIILGNTIQEHYANCRKILEILSSYNLRLQPTKCHMCLKPLAFGGHKVSATGIQPLHDEVLAIKSYPTPRNGKDISSFLGLASYYRRYIPQFADLSRPLDHLRRADPFVWLPMHDTAFNALKERLTSDVVLAYPNFEKPFLVTADASGEAIGGVVAQIDDTNRERPISYASRVLNQAERNYSTLHRECLAIIFVLTKHRYILLGYPIQINSDQKP